MRLNGGTPMDFARLLASSMALRARWFSLIAMVFSNVISVVFHGVVPGQVCFAAFFLRWFTCQLTGSFDWLLSF